MSKTIKIFYTIFIGILLALFVGVGIDAFYQAPKYPDYPVELNEYPDEKDKVKIEKRNKIQRNYDQIIKQYETDNKTYSRNVSTISLVVSVLILLSALTYINKILLISDGLLLGGLFTLIYSLIRGFEADSSIFRFLVVSVGLALSIVIGYIKFIKTESLKGKEKTN